MPVLVLCRLLEMLLGLCITIVLLKEGWDRESKPPDEAETETTREETDTLTLQMASARPRGLAELNTATRVKPIPNCSSMFIFSPSNRYATFARPIRLSYFHYFPNQCSRTLDYLFVCVYFLPPIAFSVPSDVRGTSSLTELYCHNYFKWWHMWDSLIFTEHSSAARLIGLNLL